MRIPAVDRERIIELAPKAIIHCIPEHHHQVLEQARKTGSNYRTCRL